LEFKILIYNHILKKSFFIVWPFIFILISVVNFLSRIKETKMLFIWL